MRTLVVSDLDGTLFNEDQRLSEETVAIVRSFIEVGGLFTVATARSWDSAAALIEPLQLQLPVVLINGVFVYDPMRKQYIDRNTIDRAVAEHTVALALRHKLHPIVYTMKDSGTFRIDYTGIWNASEDNYISSRLRNGDERFCKVEAYQLEPDDAVIGVNMIGTAEELQHIRVELVHETGVLCHYGPDIYTPGFDWLETTAPNASKQHGVLRLKQLVQAERLICFGDNLNDLPMFEAADEAYAMDNAHPLLKERATAIIGCNKEHGVARWLEQYMWG